MGKPLRIARSAADLAERYRANRKLRKDRIRAVRKARANELAATRSELVYYFDRLPLDQLKAVHAAAVQKFGEEPWKIPPCTTSP